MTYRDRIKEDGKRQKGLKLMFVACFKKRRKMMPKINKSNRPLELPKLTVHLFEREVVEKNYLPNPFLTNPHSSENKPQVS